MTEKLTFDINSLYHKLYFANGEKEVTLTPYEAGELLDYLDWVAYAKDMTGPQREI